MDIPATQAPPPGKINLDHVAHFVPDIDAAGAALEKLGFTLSPFSPQSHRLQRHGPLVPAGTGNRCIMLKAGYLEFLTPTSDTPVANQLRAAIRRYVGAHLIAFGTSAPDIDHARLARGGFQPLAPIALQRDIDTPAGRDTARFTVVRVPPGSMPEGRIQYCQHHTPDLLWQERWLAHPNGLAELTGVLLCVKDPREAAQRYGRFTGLAPEALDTEWRLDTARGTLSFFGSDACRSHFGVEPPALPWIAGYVLSTPDIRHTRDYFAARGATARRFDQAGWFIELPPQTGGILVFEPAADKRGT